VVAWSVVWVVRKVWGCRWNHGMAPVRRGEADNGLLVLSLDTSATSMGGAQGVGAVRRSST
jgi:hypothetical protein